MSIRIPSTLDFDMQTALRDIESELAELRSKLSEAQAVAPAPTDDPLGSNRLPDDRAIFGKSGDMHAVGLVPDPGSTAGTTRYLREDGTWATITTPNPRTLKQVKIATAGFGGAGSRPSYTYSVPAGTLAADGDMLEVITIVHPTTATFQSIRLDFGGVVALSSGLNAWGVPATIIQCAYIVRESATTVRISFKHQNYSDDNATVATGTVSNLGSNAVNLVVYGESSGGTNDIILDSLTVRLVSAI